MSGNYHTMANVAAHAAGKQAYREDFGMRRQGAPQAECAFPAPAPFRVYCQPAQFHSVNGSSYSSLVTAYGASRSCSQGY